MDEDCGQEPAVLVNGHTVLGILEELEQGGIAVPSPSTPPASHGHPDTVYFSKQLHWRWGQVAPFHLGAAVQVLGPPIPCLHPPPISLSPLLFLSSAPLSSNLITCQPVLIFASQSPSWMEGKD